jgi:hypothetical protein
LKLSSSFIWQFDEVNVPDRSLAIILKMRRGVVANARAALTNALTIEESASAAETVVTDTIRREIKAALYENVDDAAVEALAIWLPRARLHQRAALERRYAAEAETARARAVLAAARSAGAVVEGLIEVSTAQSVLDAERRSLLDQSENLFPRCSQRHS